MLPSDLEALCAFYWRVLHPQLALPQTQYRGIEGRRFRFDFAWPDAKVAVECQGGTWAEGEQRGHTRGSMYEKDCEKLALAMAQGWTVFYLTTTMLKGNPARWLGLIADAIGRREVMAQNVTDLLIKIGELAEQRDDLLAALRTVEWVDDGGEGDDRGIRCPWCNEDFFARDTRRIHAPDCPRQAAIAAASGAGGG